MRSCNTCEYANYDMPLIPCNKCMNTLDFKYYEPDPVEKLKIALNSVYGFKMIDTDALSYIKADVDATSRLYHEWSTTSKRKPLPNIKKVIYNPPATIVIWTDGTKTVVKAQDEAFDKEKGLAMAISKKAMGNEGNYYEVFKKWAPDDHIFPGVIVSDVVKNALENLRKKMCGNK